MRGPKRWWDERVVPRLADASLKGQEVGELRRDSLRPLAGDVLEFGFGSGLNVRWYPDAVTSVTAVEPSDLAWELSERRRARTDLPITRGHLDGQRLDEPDASYDAVLSTFTLCTIPDVDAALAEVRRVLRPGGVLCFLEHGLSPDPRVAAWQRRFEPMQRTFAGGCHLTRDTAALVEAAGLRVTDLRPTPLPGPAVSRPWTSVTTGVATRD